MEQEPQFELKVTAERMKGLKLGVMRKLESGNLAAIMAFVSRFMHNSERYLEQEEAYDILDELTVGELDSLAAKLKSSLEEAAVPKG